MKITLTKYTKHGGILTKKVRPDGMGGIIKDSSKCFLEKGTAEKVTPHFEEFPTFIRSLNFNQAIGSGIYEFDKAVVLSRSRFSGQPWTVTRTKEFCKFIEGPGLGCFDYDAKPGQVVLTLKEYIEIICTAHPPFRDVATVYTPSTGSCIYGDNGEELSGPSAGFHLYFPVRNASLLPRFAEILFKRLVLMGHGYPFITKPGTPLLRTIFDLSVFGPEHLYFVAGAVCEGCYQKLPMPVYSEGGML